jgi:hypothetical protein
MTGSARPRRCTTSPTSTSSPLASPLDAEQVAYAKLFAYRDNSEADPGLQGFRIINWLEATNHSFIVGRR